MATCLTTWNPATEPCPCASASLCLPVRRVDTVEKVYVMHNGFTSPHPGAPDDRYIWAQYNWSQVTTIAVFGTLSAELYCHAHAHGARVTFGYQHAPWETNFTHIWRNKTLTAEYAKSLAVRTLQTGTDGWSLDIEAPVHDPVDAAQLTGLVKAISEAVHGVLPSAQVTFASSILGVHTRTQQYDLVGISKVVDYFVVMCYDADKNLTAPDFSKANMALPLLRKGVCQYEALGIQASRLILGFPWFAYSWKCSENTATGRQDCSADHVLCHCTMVYGLANNSQPHYVGNGTHPGDIRDCSNDCRGYTVPGDTPCLTVRGIQDAGIIGEEQWDSASSTPWLRWQGGDPPPTQFELWYDNPRSLALKAEYAWSAGVGGVSMWTANALDYNNASQVAAFWGALTAGMPAARAPPAGQDVATA